MGNRNPWLLPDGVDEVLPPEAWRLERLRRKLLDVLEKSGYQLVIPPLVEYLDSLLSGIGEDLELQTFKLTDQISGRTMGVRADITPQVARIDAHRLATETPQRLCYIGPVVHTLPDKFAGSRNPLQLGAELYGHDGIESDAEVIALLHEILRAAGIGDVTIEIGHMGLFHAICESASFSDEFESDVLEMLLMKDRSGLDQLLANVPDVVRANLLDLLDLSGDASVLANARERLASAPASVQDALDQVSNLIELLNSRSPDLNLHLDFAELRGYRYHTGIMFAAYTLNVGRAIAWGGRYDNIGKTFGRARGATGFSTDLKVLNALSQEQTLELERIFAPAGSASDLLAAIRDYRAAGYVVVQALPGQTGGPRDAGCGLLLSDASGSWQVEDVDRE